MSLKTIPERLVPLSLPPGYYHNGTVYQAKGRWFNGNLVRFHSKMTLPVGGWRNVHLSGGANAQLLDGKPPRGALAFRADSATAWLVTGTPSHAYAYSNGAVTDVTPAGFTAGAIDGALSSGAYGAGTYGFGFYGVGGGAATLSNADTWQFDVFGQLEVACFTADGRILSATPGSQLVLVDATAPTGCLGVVVTPERFLVALGGTPVGGGAADSRIIQWASQGTTNIWTGNPQTNSAGGARLQSRGRLMCGRRTKNETLIWTDAELFTMIYIDAPLYYSIQKRGDACGLIAPNAVTLVGDTAFWMGFGKFHMYDGAVHDIDCDVLDVVFALAGNAAIGTQLNDIQRSKTFAITNSMYHEVTWYYVSTAQTNGTEPDRYVTYNYVEGTWVFGSLGRCAGIDRDVFQYPVLIDAAGFLFEHEVGSAMPGALVLPFLESGPIELSSVYGSYLIQTQGDVVFRIERYLPDELHLGDLQTTFFMALNPTDAETVIGPFPHTAPTTLRITARQARVRYDQVNAVSWRLGTDRLGLVPGGLR